MKDKIRELEEKRLENDIEEIENCKDDSNRMYKAIGKSTRCKPKETVLVETA